MPATTQYPSQAMETTQLRPYEISYLIRNEEDLKGVVDLLTEHGATVIDEGQVRKLSFAYPVKRVTDGYFGFLKATLSPEEVKKLENAARTSQTVLRLLIQTDEPVKAPKSSKKAAVPRAARVEKPAAPATASNDDLQKELERLTAE